jgi:hypothetical protein
MYTLRKDKMMIKSITLAMLLQLPIACLGQDISMESCLSKQKNRQAKLLSGHGLSIYVWPIDLPKDYTGCQIAWTEDGKIFAISKFHHGKILEFILKEPKERTIKCLYRLIEDKNLHEKCPSSKDFPLWIH